MSLDQNLFTLFLSPNPSYPAGTVVDLTDTSGTTHYRKRRSVTEQQQIYRIEVVDPLSEALLASATAPSATSKHKTLELYNPSIVVELKYTGTLTFRWSFKWETHDFEWKREECFIIRKPDPPVLVAVTREPPGRIKTAAVQILDYNLNRFDIEDRKGLEIVLLTALLTFQDANDAYHEPNATAIATASPSTPTTTAPAVPPKLPKKPAPKKGVERIAELQLGRGQVNEVTVFEEGAIADYAKHCARLLRDDAMLFISVLSLDPNQVPKVLQVVEETKRLRHKAGDQDLHQYVVYDSKQAMPRKGPRVINLDDHNKGKAQGYMPPTSLTVHLSKIDIPELGPRGTSFDRHPTTRHDPDNGKKKDKDSTRRDKEKKTKAKDGNKYRDSDSRSKRQSMSLHPNVIRKAHSQYIHPPSSPLSPSSLTSYRVSPSSPRQHPSGTLHRQSMYGPMNGEHHYHPYEVQHAGASNGSPLIKGLLGRFLGR